MKSLEWDLIQHDWSPYKRRRGTDRNTWGECQDHKDRDWTDAAISKRTPRIAMKLERSKERFYPKPQRETPSLRTSGVQNCKRINFLLF